MSNLASDMAQACYRSWYKKQVAPHLTKEQKETVAKHISELTLERVIWLDRDTDFTDQFPELKKYSNSGTISGLQLVSVMECIVTELSGKDFRNEKVKALEKVFSP